MNLETVSDKHIHDLERTIGELLGLMRKAKLQDETLIATLRELQQKLEKTRHDRFDSKNTEFHTY